MENAKDDSAPSELIVSTSTDQVSQINVTTDKLASATMHEVEGDFIASESTEISHGKLSEGTDELETLVTKQETNGKGLTATSLDINGQQSSNMVSAVKEPKLIEVHDVRKTSEKKSRKQKSSKVQSSPEHTKGVMNSSLQQLKRIETGLADTPDTILEVSAASMDNNQEILDSQKADDTSQSLPKSEINCEEVKGEVKSRGSIEQHDNLGNSVQQAWVPIFNIKPKSLLEIQQEKERKTHREVAVSAITSSVSSISLFSPWVGVFASSETFY